MSDYSVIFLEYKDFLIMPIGSVDTAKHLSQEMWKDGLKNLNTGGGRSSLQYSATNDTGSTDCASLKASTYDFVKVFDSPRFTDKLE